MTGRATLEQGRLWQPGRVATHSHELNDFCAATDASPRTGGVALGAVSPGSERTFISTRHPPRGRAPGCMLRLFAERAAIFIDGLRIDRARISLRSKPGSDPTQDCTDRFKGLALRHVQHDEAVHVRASEEAYPNSGEACRERD